MTKLDRPARSLPDARVIADELNTDRTPAEWRTKIHSNVLTAIIALAFEALCANAVRKAVSGSGG